MKSLGSKAEEQEEVEEEEEVVVHPTVETLRDGWDVFCSPGKSTLLVGEMIVLLRTFNFYPTELEVIRLLAEVDADANGECDFAEFVTLVEGLERNIQKDEYMKAFRLFDEGGTGFVEKEVLHRLLTTVLKVDTDELEYLFRDVIMEEDGTVSRFGIPRLLLYICCFIYYELCSSLNEWHDEWKSRSTTCYLSGLSWHYLEMTFPEPAVT